MKKESNYVGDEITRQLTLTPITPKTKLFTHTPLGEELYAELQSELGLVVVAGYIRRNGTSPYEYMLLYVDRARSDTRWKDRLDQGETWAHDECFEQIRDVLFRVLTKHNLELPIEKAYDQKTGELVSDTCFNVSLYDFDDWQKYWKTHDR